MRSRRRATASPLPPELEAYPWTARPDGDETAATPLATRRIPATGVEHAGKTPGIWRVCAKRGTESGTPPTDSPFAAALTAVMRLPLTDAEKAEAVRRLLASTAHTPGGTP